MTKNHAVVAVFADHTGAEAAIRKIAGGGLDVKHFSIIGKGYHTEEKVIGFYNIPVISSSSGARTAPCGAASGACSSAAY